MERHPQRGHHGHKKNMLDTTKYMFETVKHQKKKNGGKLGKGSFLLEIVHRV